MLDKVDTLSDEEIKRGEGYKGWSIKFKNRMEYLKTGVVKALEILEDAGKDPEGPKKEHSTEEQAKRLEEVYGRKVGEKRAPIGGWIHRAEKRLVGSTAGQDERRSLQKGHRSGGQKRGTCILANALLVHRIDNHETGAKEREDNEPEPHQERGGSGHGRGKVGIRIQRVGGKKRSGRVAR